MSPGVINMKRALSILVGVATAALLFAAPASTEPKKCDGPEFQACAQACNEKYARPEDPYGAASSPQGYACLQNCRARYPG